MILNAVDVFVASHFFSFGTTLHYSNAFYNAHHKHANMQERQLQFYLLHLLSVFWLFSGNRMPKSKEVLSSSSGSDSDSEVDTKVCTSGYLLFMYVRLLYGFHCMCVLFYLPHLIKKKDSYPK